MSVFNNCRLPILVACVSGFSLGMLLVSSVSAQDLTALSVNAPSAAVSGLAPVSSDPMLAPSGTSADLPPAGLAQPPLNAAAADSFNVAPALPQSANEPPPLPIAAQTPVPITESTGLPDVPPASRSPALPGETAASGEITANDLAVPDFFSGKDDMLGLTEEGDFNYEKSKQELQEEARRQAFNQALQALMPLRPNEIREMLEKFDRTQESVEVPVYPAPKPQMVVENISLDPGAQPAVIKLAFGHVTTLSVLDASGAPWPIEDISWAGDFEITETSEGDGAHIVRISPRSEYAVGNMSMRLLTLKTPVILMMETNRDLVHYRFDAIIPDYGPMATAPLIRTGVNLHAGDQTISSVLQGMIPNAAVRLNVSGADGRTSAYKIGSLTYVRTPLTLLSPSWSNSVASADGTRVYAIQDAPVLLLSDKGKMVRAHLTDREDIFDE